MRSNPVTIGTRLASMILDHFIMTLIMVIIMVPLSMALIDVEKLTTTSATTPLHMMDPQFLLLMLIGLSVYLCKDCIGGRSFAKRIIKHQVVDRQTLLPASPLQCLLRNFLIIFWPLEVLFVLFSPD
jgi:uncharacterized RDD family membrane protein YckC